MRGYFVDNVNSPSEHWHGYFPVANGVPDPWPELSVSHHVPLSPVYQHTYQPSYQPITPPDQHVAPQHLQPARSHRHQYRVESEWYAASEESFEGRLQQELNLSEIQVELDRHNYKRKFHHLICWEERKHIEILGNK